MASPAQVEWRSILHAKEHCARTANLRKEPYSVLNVGGGVIETRPYYRALAYVAKHPEVKIVHTAYPEGAPSVGIR
jgi:hypothetical protein